MGRFENHYEALNYYTKKLDHLFKIPRGEFKPIHLKQINEYKLLIKHNKRMLIQKQTDKITSNHGG